MSLIHRATIGYILPHEDGFLKGNPTSQKTGGIRVWRPIDWEVAREVLAEHGAEFRDDGTFVLEGLTYPVGGDTLTLEATRGATNRCVKALCDRLRCRAANNGHFGWWYTPQDWDEGPGSA